MRDYSVQVIDRTTGAESVITITATSTQDAFAIAVKNGWIVGWVKPVPKKIDLPKPGLCIPSFLYACVGGFGLLGLLITLGYSPTVEGPGEYRFTTRTVYNIGMMHHREVWTIVCTAAILVGVVGSIGCQMLAEIRKLQGPAEPKSD